MVSWQRRIWCTDTCELYLTVAVGQVILSITSAGEVKLVVWRVLFRSGSEYIARVKQLKIGLCLLKTYTNNCFSLRTEGQRRMQAAYRINFRKNTGETDRHQTDAICFLLWTRTQSWAWVGSILWVGLGSNVWGRRLSFEFQKCTHVQLCAASVISFNTFNWDDRLYAFWR